METTKMIYTDPVNERLPEGLAFLLFNMNELPAGSVDGKRVEFWKVRFIETGRVTERLILID